MSRRALGGKRRSSAAELDECLSFLPSVRPTSEAACIDALLPSPMSNGSAQWRGAHSETEPRRQNYAQPTLVLRLASSCVRQSESGWSTEWPVRPSQQICNSSAIAGSHAKPGSVSMRSMTAARSARIHRS